MTQDPSGQSGQNTPPPPDQAPPPPPPPPQQNWQSAPQQPAPPPPGGPAGGMPSWTSNITAQGTIPGPGGVALADTPNRIIAAVIDFIILGIIGWIVSMLTTSLLGENILGGIFGDFRVPSLLSGIVAVALMLVISGAYFIGMWTMMGGATVGQKVLKLTVRDATTGGAISQQQAINRWLVLGAAYAIAWLQWSVLGLIAWIAVLVYYIYLLVTVAQSPTRQGLHDQYAKTVVAKG